MVYALGTKVVVVYIPLVAKPLFLITLPRAIERETYTTPQPVFYTLLAIMLHGVYIKLYI